jgi:hypothetical protein
MQAALRSRRAGPEIGRPGGRGECVADGRLVIYPRGVDIDDGHLFDPDAYPAPPPPPGEEEFGEIAKAVREERTLVPGPDGLPARLIHLHSLDKAYYVRFYAEIVGASMAKKWGGETAWVELYSGPGKLWVKEQNTFMDGSPMEALGIKKPFGTYVFADLDQHCVDALAQRIFMEYSGPRAHVLQGDANSPELHDHIRNIVPKRP